MRDLDEDRGAGSIKWMWKIVKERMEISTEADERLKWRVIGFDHTENPIYPSLTDMKKNRPGLICEIEIFSWIKCYFLWPSFFAVVFIFPLLSFLFFSFFFLSLFLHLSLHFLYLLLSFFASVPSFFLLAAAFTFLTFLFNSKRKPTKKEQLKQYL